MIIARVLAAAAALCGAAAWMVLLRADLVLSHYDARAHLVVARRVIDSLTPGWQQVGAVWLPLPHVLHVLPAQVDVLYRTGAFASLVSIACLATSSYAAARLVLLATGSPFGAMLAAALLVLNPNLLYLHATPMTEPLLLASVLLALLWLVEWVPLNADRVPRRLGWALFAAMLTRYEAWPVVIAATAAAAWASRRLGTPRPLVLRRAARLATWPAAAIGLVLINSRITLGTWLVTGGFYVPDPTYEGDLLRSTIAVWWGAHQLSTRATVAAGLVAAAVFASRAFLRRAESALLVPVTLIAAASLPLYALYAGHPFRVRYMTTLVVACAIFSGMAVGTLRRYPAIILAGLLGGMTLIDSPPWRRDAPLIVEALWDRPAGLARRRVTECLADYRGEKILASMGSLAHYMHDLSAARLDIADFIHEGNGVIWQLALETGPAPHAGWMLVEEVAEGGDVLADAIRRDPAFAAGMSRICEGGGVALYRRTLRTSFRS